MPTPLTPVAVGQVFTAQECTFTRLPDDPKPYWRSEPFVIRCHANPGKGVPEQVFPQGQSWFNARGYRATTSEEP